MIAIYKVILKYGIISSVTRIIYHETPLQSLTCGAHGSFLNLCTVLRIFFLPLPIFTDVAEQISSNLRGKKLTGGPVAKTLSS